MVDVGLALERVAFLVAVCWGLVAWLLARAECARAWAEASSWRQHHTLTIRAQADWYEHRLRSSTELCRLCGLRPQRTPRV